MVYTISINVWITSMPIKYIVLVVGGNERDNTPMKVLINKITEQEKLQEVKM
jgi:hypothetical protein